MKTIGILLKRNIKLFFNDKGMFLTSLITPLILLVLYITFLGNVYRDSFAQNFKGIEISEEILNGIVSGQLISSILAVSCVTVAFCSNFLMVQDKALGNIKDITIAPINSHILSLSYYGAAACLLYVSLSGWYLSALDVVLIFVDVILLVLFGTVLSSIINYFLSTLGQISAVGTIVSSAYGFICGAYMPISSFPEGLQKVISFLPGTYGTSLLREHAMRGALNALANELPAESVGSISGIKDAFDLNIYFYGNIISEELKYIILCSIIVVLIIGYLIINKYAKVKKEK